MNDLAKQKTREHIAIICTKELQSRSNQLVPCKLCRKIARRVRCRHCVGARCEITTSGVFSESGQNDLITEDDLWNN